jgi:UDP-N-acetylmuramate dehydrogenase
MPYAVIGKGSNVLVSDKGFRGGVIFTQRLNKIELKSNVLIAEAGATVKEVIKTAISNNLSGLEFAVGIPGSIGGLVAMNGGCFNKSVSDVVCYVIADGGVYNKKACDFNYRYSRFLDGEIIHAVALKLKVSEEDVIEQKIERFTKTRTKNQPKGNSAGSIFLNQGYFAGKLIDQAGLKGYKIGGACVSEKHGNFIINNGGTAQDIFELIAYVKENVFKKTNIKLTEEIRYIGEF